MSDQSTVPEEGDVDEAASARVPDVLALVLIWCDKEPFRIGEAIIVPPGAPGPQRVFGRGPAVSSDPHPRLQLVRDRPWSPEATPPVGIETISRVQLVLRARDAETLEVQNVGQAPLEHEGLRVTNAEVRAGEMIQVGRQMLLLCVRRSQWPRCEWGLFQPTPFGAPDACGIVGESPAVWELRKMLAFVGPKRGHVLVTGPSGTGKELAARAVHKLSERSTGPFIARSAATLPAGIVDAELFGNARNYPNPGIPERPGLVGQAHEGSLFLDEFAELAVDRQAHLLRLLDAGEYHRLGESKARTADIRLIAATNREHGALKHDLLGRLTFRIAVPELNHRPEDIPLLVRHLLRTFAAENPGAVTRFFSGPPATGEAKISPELMRQLVRHDYATHVRELARFLWEAIERSRADVLTSTEAARTSSTPRPFRISSNGAALAPGTVPPPADASDEGELTPERIQACLDSNNGALETTWRVLGLKNRYVLSRLIAKYGLEVRRRRGASPSRK